MTKANRIAARSPSSAYHTVHLHMGEGLWQAKRRWKAESGCRGLALIR
jgi:hypothetical protein